MKLSRLPIRKILIATYLVCFSFEIGRCQQALLPIPNDQKLRIAAVKTNQKIKVDGRLTDSAWALAPEVTNFTVSYPAQGKKPVNQTEVKVLYDDANLYIGAVCHYLGGKRHLQVVNMSRDFSYSYNELFNVMLGPFQDIKSPVLSLSVSPYNTQLDIMHFYDGSYNYNWNAVWRSACSINDSTWIAEMAIPFSSIRFPVDSTIWGINFTRNDRTTGELSGWSLWPMAYSASRLDYGGLLTNLHLPGEKLNLRLQPYLLLKSSGGHQTKLQQGGDIRWAVNTNTLLDATFNTDFAQTDVDLQVINLSRSSVFFPEKRQFFLENANLFSIGKNAILQPFFSRRIGLSDAGVILPIDAGVRLVSQSASQAYGFLAMKQESDSTSGSTWFNVMRYRKNIGKNLQAGVMEVTRINEPTKTTKASFNPVSSVDLFWRPNHTMYLRSMGSVSTDNAVNKKGWASLLEFNYTTNKMSAGLVETIINDGYNANAGFIVRRNMINTQPYVTGNLHRNWFPHSIAFFTPLIAADIYHAANTRNFLEAGYSVSPFGLTFRDYAQIRFNINSSKQHLTQDFQPVTGLTIPGGDYDFTSYELKAQTDQAAHYSIAMDANSGEFYNGKLNSYSLNLRAAPIPHIALTLNYTRNNFNRVGDLNGKLSTYLISPQVLLALNANIQLSGIYQYSSQAKSGNLNFRFSWQYKPLSYFYVVYNRIPDESNLPGKKYLDNAIIKASYIVQL